MYTQETTRLRAAAAAMQMSLGLAVYQFPHEFGSAAFDPLRPFFPYLAVALMAAGVVLLLWRMQSPTALLQAVAMLPAGPLATLAVWTTKTGGWSGTLLFGLTTVALLAAPWLPGRMTRANGWGRDLFSITAGIILGALGVLLLVWPTAFGSGLYTTVAHVLPLLGILGVTGAAAMLLPLAKSPWIAGLQTLAGVMLPALLVYSWASVGVWTGVMGWGVLVVGIICNERMLVRIRHRTGADRNGRSHTMALGAVERTLERWTWLMAVLVVMVMALGGESAFLRPSFAHMFVVAVSAYNAVVHRFLPHLGSPAGRVHAHLLLLAFLGGILHVSGGPAGHGYLTLLVVVPPLATQAFGIAAGHRYLTLVVAVVVGSEALGWWLAGGHDSMLLSGATAMQVVLLLVAANVGIRNANESRRQQHELEAALESLQQGAAERDRLVAILDATPDLVGMADTNGQVMYVNRAGRAVFGLSQDGPPCRHSIGLDHPDWAWQVIKDEAWPSAAQTGLWRGETAILTRGGDEIPVLQTVIAHRSVTGEVAYYSTIMRDITEQKQLEAQLRYLAQHDDLTGLPNRRHFQAELRHRLEQPDSGIGSVLLVDLDGFKDVNDTFGHGAGDRLLHRLALVLQEQVRETDLVARLGGDEFAVLLPHASMGEAEEVARRILDAVGQQTIVFGERTVRAAASIGVACFPGHGTTVDELMANADFAMYEAKTKSRNEYAIYVPSESRHEQATARIAWDARLRRALAEDRFVLECQPVLMLDTDETCQYELLLRMLGDHGELIPPSAFIGVAESLGLVHGIDRWVVRQAIQLLADHTGRRGNRALAVNLSAKAFADQELFRMIVDELDRTGADPGRLIFEITETAVIADIQQARRFIEGLSQCGCRFAIDDFGTGFSSYTVLRQLPVHFLKLDRSLVTNIATDDADRDFVRAMTSIAHRLGQQVIAEGVSDAETVALLRELKVDCAQGYFLGRPRPIAECKEYATVTGSAVHVT